MTPRQFVKPAAKKISRPTYVLVEHMNHVGDLNRRQMFRDALSHLPAERRQPIARETPVEDAGGVLDLAVPQQVDRGQLRHRSTTGRGDGSRCGLGRSRQRSGYLGDRGVVM